ncbi:MAG: Gfo/Idh/MocA family oxidoreductase [Planctomycetota bacterium]
MTGLKKRYAVVGVSSRSINLFMNQMLDVYTDYAEFVAMLDKDRGRMQRYNTSRNLNIPTYIPEEFDKMIKETRPDVVIVACQDSIHHHYIIKALGHNLDVISEKPLTIDEEKCASIVAAEIASKGTITVTFNYRYIPYATRIRELIEGGKVGKVVSVDMNWYLDTNHGSSYFQRWNRLRELSGGLSVHKACHHLDIVSWWIGQRAVEVFSYGALNFYGPKGYHNPLKPGQIGDGRTCPTCDARSKCKYYMRWNRAEYRGTKQNKSLGEHVDSAQNYEDYSPRQCIFDPPINIEDTYTAVIKYNGGAFLNYSLNGSVPYEGVRFAINGTEGRIEYFDVNSPWGLPFPDPGSNPVVYIPMFGGRELIDVVNLGGSHSGSDPLMCDELFIGKDKLAPVDRTASLRDGIDAVLTGVAIYKSAHRGIPISIEQMRQNVYVK